MPPPHVAIILADGVRVVGMTQGIHAALVERGRTVIPTKYGPVLPWERSQIQHAEDQALIELLQLLAELGVGFALDIKQMWSPASLVDELIQRGVEFRNPWATAYDGTWVVRTHPWYPWNRVDSS